MTHWRMARAMELFFYLLDCGRPMRKEQIITALWPEVDEQTTRTFYSTIYYLRQALGGEAVIVAKGGTYTLRLDALYGDGIWYDVAAFKDHQARAKLALEQEQDKEARAAYLAMVEQYAARFAVPFDPPDALRWATERGARSGRVAWQYITEVAGRAGRKLTE